MYPSGGGETKAEGRGGEKTWEVEDRGRNSATEQLLSEIPTGRTRKTGRGQQDIPAQAWLLI